MDKSNFTILVVDDEVDIVEIITESLQDNGFKTLSANSVKEAEAVLAENEVNMVLTDVKMPGESGFALLERTKLPVILITGHLDISEVDAKERGAVTLLSKPFKVDEIVEIIESVIALS